MMNLTSETVKSEYLGPLGLLASVIHELGIIEKIEARIPLNEEKGGIVSHGRRVAAMILNGLGFMNSRLYMTSHFFQDKPVSHLLNAEITAGNLNDDCLGRCLDKIAEYGVTKLYSESVNESIKKQNPENELSRLQCYWLGFIILGLLVTNSFCFARFERFGLGHFNVKQMSWMFRRAKIFWEALLQASVAHMISAYGIKYGVLVIDDSDRERSKNAVDIGGLHKIRDKKTGGYINGQNVVFLLLVCEKITLPVGFYFHEPDPKKIAWRKEDARLRKQGIEKKH